MKQLFLTLALLPIMAQAQFTTYIESGVSHAAEGNAFCIKSSFGYTHNTMFIGAGAGLDIYPVNRLIPLTVELKAIPLYEQVSPVFSLSAGYSLPSDTSFKGGIIVNPQIGVRYKFHEKNSVVLSVGYKSQTIKSYSIRYDSFNKPIYTPLDISKNFVTFMVAFSF